MHITRVFKNGNSQAVRIPAKLAYERTDVNLEIERIGDEIWIRPARRSLSGVLYKFARFSPGFMAEGRGGQEQAEGERREQERAREAQRQKERQQTDKAASDQQEAERILERLLKKAPVLDSKTERAIDGLFHDIARSRSRGRGR
jgi:antitoxin VapB